MSRIHLTALGLLNEKPRHGYELQQVVRERHLDRWAGINPNSVYKALQSLESKGYIGGHDEIEGNNPVRTVYHITVEGRKELERLVRQTIEGARRPSEFWLGIAFVAGTMTKRELIRAIDDHIDKVRQHTEREEQQLGDVLRTQPNIPFNWQALIGMGMNMGKSMMAQLQELRQRALACDDTEFYKPEIPLS